MKEPVSEMFKYKQFLDDYPNLNNNWLQREFIIKTLTNPIHKSLIPDYFDFFKNNLEKHHFANLDKFLLFKKALELQTLNNECNGLIIDTTLLLEQELCSLFTVKYVISSSFIKRISQFSNKLKNWKHPDLKTNLWLNHIPPAKFTPNCSIDQFLDLLRRPGKNVV